MTTETATLVKEIENPNERIMKKAFGLVALALIVGAGGYLEGYKERDIQAKQQLKTQKLGDVQRLREAFGCDTQTSAPRCTMLDFERDQIISNYTIGGTPG